MTISGLISWLFVKNVTKTGHFLILCLKPLKNYAFSLKNNLSDLKKVKSKISKKILKWNDDFESHKLAFI